MEATTVFPRLVFEIVLMQAKEKTNLFYSHCTKSKSILALYKTSYRCNLYTTLSLIIYHRLGIL